MSKKTVKLSFTYTFLFLLLVPFQNCTSSGFQSLSTSSLSSVAANSSSGGTSSSTARPSYNKGTGFYVIGSKLYDPNGKEFRVRGVNKTHWDQSAPGLVKAGVNTVRWAIDFTQSPASNVSLLKGSSSTPGGTIAGHVVVMPGNWTGTCEDGSATAPTDGSLAPLTTTMQSIVDTWVAQASYWTQLEKYSIINIANEWGPSDSTVWRDNYIQAIAALRAAGYHATLSITSGGCGQDPADLAKYAQAVFDSDPEKNVIFDQHVYGNFMDPEVATPTWEQNLVTSMTALGTLGVPVILGEFGPGRDIGPSPTMTTPLRVMQLAEANSLGWLAWAWDDNDLAEVRSDNGWFALTYTWGIYTTTTDLTMFGQQVVEGCNNPTAGGCGCSESTTTYDAAGVPTYSCSGTFAPSYNAFSTKSLSVLNTAF